MSLRVTHYGLVTPYGKINLGQKRSSNDLLNNSSRPVPESMLTLATSNDIHMKAIFFMLDLTPGFIGLGKHNCKTREKHLSFGFGASYTKVLSAGQNYGCSCHDSLLRLDAHNHGISTTSAISKLRTCEHIL